MNLLAAAAAAGGAVALITLAVAQLLVAVQLPSALRVGTFSPRVVDDDEDACPKKEGS